MKTQVEKFVHIPQQIFLSHQPQIDLTEKILDFTPKKLDTIFYVNSGSEATDNSYRIYAVYVVYIVYAVYVVYVV